MTLNTVTLNFIKQLITIRIHIFTCYGTCQVIIERGYVFIVHLIWKRNSNIFLLTFLNSILITDLIYGLLHVLQNNITKSYISLAKYMSFLKNKFDNCNVIYTIYPYPNQISNKICTKTISYVNNIIISYIY